MTAQTSTPGPPFGPSAIAAYWRSKGLGCSRQYADKCIKALGCPTGSLEEALAWRTARTVAGSRSKGGGESDAPSGDEGQKKIRIAPPVEILGGGLDATLARARQTEEVQYRVWLAACADGDLGAQTVALRNHKDAQKNLVEIEALVIEGKKARGELVDLAEAQARIADRLSPLRAARSTLSRTLALTFFADAPHRAQPRIEEELVRVLDPAVNVAARPLLTKAAPPATAAA